MKEYLIAVREHKSGQIATFRVEAETQKEAINIVYNANCLCDIIAVTVLED